MAAVTQTMAAARVVETKVIERAAAARVVRAAVELKVTVKLVGPEADVVVMVVERQARGRYQCMSVTAW